MAVLTFNMSYYTESVKVFHDVSFELFLEFEIHFFNFSSLHFYH